LTVTILQIEFNDFELLKYKDDYDLLKELEESQLYPPRFSLKYARKSRNATVNTILTVNIEQECLKKVGDFLFQVDTGKADQIYCFLLHYIINKYW